MRKGLYILLAFALYAITISCTKNRTTYSSFVDFKDMEWPVKSPVRFDVTAFDSISGDNLLLTVRHSNDYPYRNLWLFIDLIDERGQIKTDTANITLADISGRWYGNGFGAIYELTLPLRLNSNLHRLKNVVISQGMRDDTIKGIINIGITLKQGR